MPRQILWLITLVLIGLVSPAKGQNITVINHYGDTTGMGNVEFSLQDSQQHTILINYYKPATGAEISRLEQLIGSALDFYIDQIAEVDASGVSYYKSKGIMVREMNEIVTRSFELYGFRNPKDFDGFSRAVVNKLEAIEDLNLSKGDWNQLRDEAAKSQFRKAYVQTELNNLKSIVNGEIGHFPESSMMVVAGSDVEILSPEEQAMLLAEIEGFEKHDPLEPIEFEFSESTLTLLASEDQFLLPDYTSPPAPAGGDEFAMRVLSMLEENNRKLGDLQLEVNDLRVQQEKDRRVSEARRNDDMQLQIDGLRELMLKLVGEGSTAVVLPPKPVAGVANLPGAVTVNFSVGGIYISGANKFILNEVIDLLAHHPTMKIMVTGYADKTGSAESNLLISQKRAKSVRNYVLQSGLSSDRVIMNYYGDRDSTGPGISDRKVVIEFLQY